MKAWYLLKTKNLKNPSDFIYKNYRFRKSLKANYYEVERLQTEELEPDDN